VGDVDLARGNTTSSSPRFAALALIALTAALVVHGVLCVAAAHEIHGLPAHHHHSAVTLSAPDVIPEAQAGEPTVAAVSPEIRSSSPMLGPAQDHPVLDCPAQLIPPARLDVVVPVAPVAALLGLTALPVLWTAAGVEPGPTCRRGRGHTVTCGLFMRICVLRT